MGLVFPFEASSVYLSLSNTLMTFILMLHICCYNTSAELANRAYVCMCSSLLSVLKENKYANGTSTIVRLIHFVHARRIDK